MNKTKIAAGLIVKNDDEVLSLRRCLESVMPYVEATYITVTQKPYKEIKKLSKQYGFNLDIRPGEFNYTFTKEDIDWLREFLKWEPQSKVGDTIFLFGSARNANLNFIPDEYEWFFWIDADDILINGQFLHQIADDAYHNGFESVFLNYLYQVEIENNQIKSIIVEHLRERLVRIDKDYRKVWKWIGEIHEILINQRETMKIEDKRMDILHLAPMNKRLRVLDRNFKNLEYQILKSKGTDPRPIYYLGKCFYDKQTTETHQKAEQLIYIYLAPYAHANNMSGWREERAQAFGYLAEIYRSKSEHNNSIKALHNSLIEYSQDPATYYSLALSHMLKQDWDTARFWTILGSKVPQSRNTLVTNPRDIETRAYEVLYNCGIHLNKIDEAHEAAQRLHEMYPNDPVIKQQWEFIDETRQIRDVTENYVKLSSYLAQRGETDKLRPLLAAAPSTIVNNPLVVKLYQDLYPPKVHDENEITIYCGPQFTIWTPKYLEDPKNSFVGGSEEAVVYLSREFSKLGWKVTVYADPGTEPGEYDGVKWEPYFHFNLKDQFNILILWRQIGWVDMNCQAKKIYLWSHDVLNQVEYTKERLEKLAKVIVLSKAHRENLSDVPDNKILISSNGYFEHYPNVKPTNRPTWCLYSSSYDRGLQNLLEIWPDVRKEVPEAELHIFYGWQLFQRFYRDNPERMAWMDKMNQLMKQDGITHHGRISQPEVEKWYKKCGIFSYPSHFYEINCISAIKSQLWGCVPVVTNFAALKETVQFGKKVEGEIYENVCLPPETKEKYKQELISVLKDHKWQEEQRKQMRDWAKEKYSWTNTALQWDQEFKNIEEVND